MTGTLKLDQHANKMHRCVTPLDLTPKENDGLVRLGELVMLLNPTTRSAISVSPDAINRPHCVTAARGELAQPCGRSTFFLERYEAAKPSAYEPLFEGDLVRYGQKVRLVVNPQTAGEEPNPCGGTQPLYVCSRSISADYAAKRSKHQYVGLTAARSYDSVWQILAVDPQQRGMSEGLEVQSGAPFVLVHCQTNQALCVESEFPVTTDFGAEFEVSSFNSTAKGYLEATKTEMRTTRIPLEPNYFVFINGSASAQEGEEQPAQQGA